MRDFLVAGNWKMNGDSAGNAELVAGIIRGAPESARVKLLVCPPYPYLGAVANQVAGTSIALGAQNVSEHESGAFTGEVSTTMLLEAGCEYVIVGHSERRALFGETSSVVAAKFRAVLESEMTPILCVGETLDERESDRTETVVVEQLAAAVEVAGIEAFDKAVIAYEPVWAIGTGRTASPEQAQAVHRHIRDALAGYDAETAEDVLILYGGSVKGDNAVGLFSMPDIDGGLIGGASLKADDFLAIASAAAQIED